MGERSESKRVCRRSALALFGYAAVFGLVASPAILMVSDADAQTPPTTPATPSTETPKSGTERRQERRARAAQNGVRNDARGVQNDVRHAARGAQSDAKSGATVPPKRKSECAYPANRKAQRCEQTTVVAAGALDQASCCAGSAPASSTSGGNYRAERG